MQFFDDGKIGLSLEPMIGVLRLLLEPATEGKPAFVASGVLVRMSDSVCKLVGFNGAMSIRHQALLAKSLGSMGYTVAYVERADGGTIAFGEPVTEGDFKGCVRLDLDAANQRGEQRYGSAGALEGVLKPA